MLRENADTPFSIHVKNSQTCWLVSAPAYYSYMYCSSNIHLRLKLYSEA